MSAAVRLALDATPLLGQRSGVATFVAGALGVLAGRRDVDVTVYGLTGRGRLAVDGVTVGRRAPAALALRAWSAGLRWPSAEWLAGGPVDVVHGTNFAVPPSRGAARVVTVHDLTAVTFPELCAPASLRYPALVRRAAAEGAWVHTPSRYVADEVCDVLGVPEEHVRAVAHGIDAVAGGDPATGRRLAGGDCYVLAVGTVEPRKDLPLLVRAFDRVAEARSDVRLVVAGRDGWGAEALGDVIDHARHRDRITRMGYIDAATRRDLLAGAGLFAFTSVYEGFGLPPLEAMAAGVPVVATAAGAVPEVVGDAALMVPVGDEEAMAGGLATVLDDPDLAGALAEQGKARAATFSWERCGDGLCELYEAACASR